MATCAVQRADAPTTGAPVHRGDPILVASLTRPGVPEWAVLRERITNRIAEGTRCCGLTVLTGPVGAGKTMALAIWAAAQSGRLAWVSLDEYHNRSGVFLSYVVEALRLSGVVVPWAFPASGGRAAENLFLLRLASVLAAQDPPLTLVLDDFHVIDDPRILNGLGFLLRNVGPSLRLVLSSRTDPPLSLHRYRLAGQLAEIRTSDLAFTVDEARLLLTQHGCTLSAQSLDCLVRQTEGWAGGLRLAAISMATRPDHDRFVNDLLTEDSDLTSLLQEEVFNAQPPEVRELLLSTSILEQVNEEFATELTGDQSAGHILWALAHGNAFVEQLGGGWYRYHALFAQMLRRKLMRASPARIAAVRRQAALWCQRNGQPRDALRHAAQAGDWQLAADIVIEGLPISEIIEPMGSPSTADELACMPLSGAWREPQPHLVSAAVALSTGRIESALAGLHAAEEILERLPADQSTAARLAMATIHIAVGRRSGNLDVAVQAVTSAEGHAAKAANRRPDRHEGIPAHVRCARGTVALWSGDFDEAVHEFGSGVAAAAASGWQHERAACLGHLALTEALRGRLGRAAMLADQAAAACTGDGQSPPAQRSTPAALLALAWVHLQHHELKPLRDRLKQANSALCVNPDRLLEAIACLVTAYGALVEGHDDMVVQSVTRARSGWQVPAWLQQELSLVELRASVAAGKIPAALTKTEPADQNSSLLARVILAHERMAAGDGESARRVLEPLLAIRNRVPDRVRLQALLVDARLCYHRGDSARGRRSLGRALRLADREQLRLPFALDRGWIEPVLRRDPQLAYAHRHLLPQPASHRGVPVPPDPAHHTAVPVIEPITAREREVLRGISSMKTTAEIATELYISPNTVKTHVRNVCRKLSATHRGEAVRTARHLQLI